jgi:hypothetical protein
MGEIGILFHPHNRHVAPPAQIADHPANLLEDIGLPPRRLHDFAAVSQFKRTPTCSARRASPRLQGQPVKDKGKHPLQRQPPRIRAVSSASPGGATCLRALITSLSISTPSQSRMTRSVFMPQSLDGAKAQVHRRQRRGFGSAWGGIPGPVLQAACRGQSLRMR